MKLFALLLLCALAPACQVTMPLGENGEYGEIYGGYRPPSDRPVVRKAIDLVGWRSPAYRDK